MNWNHIKPYIEIIKFQSKDTLPQTKITIQAFVDAIVPRSSELAEKQGPIQFSGALDLHSDEYLIWALNHQPSLRIIIKNFNIYLANATAEMLNIAAKQLIYTGANKKPINPDIGPEAGTFAALEPGDRLRVITLLEELEIDLSTLPVPFHNTPGFVLAISRVLTMLTIKGYYTEWSGYGSTRLESPEQRRLEDFPLSWKQVGYPGPSMGYHALRGYFTG